MCGVSSTLIQATHVLVERVIVSFKRWIDVILLSRLFFPVSGEFLWGESIKTLVFPSPNSYMSLSFGFSLYEMEACIIIFVNLRLSLVSN